MTRKVEWVLDADLRGFLDAISHEWAVKFVEHRIGDKRVIRLIQKWLKAGVLEDGIWAQAEEGTPQGGSATPPTKWQNAPIESIGASHKGSGGTRNTTLTWASTRWNERRPGSMLVQQARYNFGPGGRKHHRLLLPRGSTHSTICVSGATPSTASVGLE